MARSANATAARHGRDDALQRVGAFTALPALLRQLGSDPDAILAAAGLPPDALSSPDQRIAYTGWGRLFELSTEASGKPHFGLLAGRMWHLCDLGTLGDAVRHAACVGDALQTLTVHQHLNSGGGLAFLVRRAAVVDFGYAIYHGNVRGVDQIYASVLAAGFNYVRELAGPTWVPSQVFLPHARPADTSFYRTVFKVVPRFDAEFCAMRFPAHWLDREIDGAIPERRRVALARIHESVRPDLLDQVGRALRLLLLRGKTSGDDLAQMLAMHRRTLNRRLHERGTTFQNVLDEVRFEVARQLLVYSELALDDIAASLGYAGVSPFMRSFHRWTGQTPGQWRRSASGAASARMRSSRLEPRHGAEPSTAVGVRQATRPMARGEYSDFTVS